MPQTFYVTQDEEILSLMGRLRSSALIENVFVVPKRALILQSVVNLRILAREAEKLGKSIVIVTQDNDGRMLAEKAGISTRAFSDEPRFQKYHPQTDQGVHVPEKAPVAPSHRVAIGSDNFFDTGIKAPVQPAVPVHENVPPTENGETRLRIRDNNSKNITSLNSINQSSLPLKQAPSHPAENPGEVLRRQVLKRPIQTHPSSRESVRMGPRTEGTAPPGRLSKIFRDQSKDRSTGAPTAGRPIRVRPSEDGVHIGSKVKFWFFLFTVISMLSLIGTSAFLFLPKAEIIVVPNSFSHSLEMTFEGKTEGAASDKEITIRLIEKELEITTSIETSGDSAGNGEKAKGKITISNEYSKEPQPLVATTRFESSDGKIFRLVRGITVPGMSEMNGKKKPGVIEAEVVADEAGETYNIEPSTFTIPGFKGGPKFTKFSATSTEKMVGGSSHGETHSSAVSAADIVRAKAEAERIFREQFEAAVRAESSDADRILVSSMSVMLVGTPSHPEIGVAASSFEYVSRWAGKVFVFSDDELRAKASDIIKSRFGIDNETKIVDISFEYNDATANYDQGLLYIRVRVTTLFVNVIDTESLRNDFLGKSAKEIKDALEKYPKIKKMEINLKPKFFSFSIPKDRDRVTVRVEEY